MQGPRRLDASKWARASAGNVTLSNIYSDLLDKSLAKRRPIYLLTGLDGVAIWFQHIVKVVLARGEPATRQGLGINIAERKRAREEDLPLFAQVLSQRATMIPVDDLVVSHGGGVFLRLVFGQVPRIRLREPSSAGLQPRQGHHGFATKSRHRLR